jgi:hypothetical protein
MHVQLVIDTADVIADRVNADVKFVSCSLIPVALGQAFE